MAINKGHEGGETAAGEGVDVEGSGHYERAVLQEAIREGCEDLVRLVLQGGAGPKKTRAGHTALQITVMNGCGGVVRLLLDYGANVEEDNWEDETLLHQAVKNGLEHTAGWLLEHGADIKRGTIFETQHYI